MKRTKRYHRATLTAQAALAAVKGDQTDAADVAGVTTAPPETPNLTASLAKIGRLAWRMCL